MVCGVWVGLCNCLVYCTFTCLYADLLCQSVGNGCGHTPLLFFHWSELAINKCIYYFLESSEVFLQKSLWIIINWCTNMVQQHYARVWCVCFHAFLLRVKCVLYYYIISWLHSGIVKQLIQALNWAFNIDIHVFFLYLLGTDLSLRVQPKKVYSQSKNTKYDTKKNRKNRRRK